MVKGQKKRAVDRTRCKKNASASSHSGDSSTVLKENHGKATANDGTRTTPPVTRSTRIDDYFPVLGAEMATAEEVASEHSYSRRRPAKREPPCPLQQLVEPEVQIPCPDAAALPAGLSLTATQPPSMDAQKPAADPRGHHDRRKSASRAANRPAVKVTVKAAAAASEQDPSKAAKRKTDVQCHSLTEYFSIRRSGRKTKTTLAKERQKQVEDAILNGIEEGFQITEFPDKGRGVTTSRPLKAGDFVLEYAGELIDVQEAKLREQIYATDTSIGCYMYYFTCRNKQYCVDATKETGRLGRLVNHSKRGNLKTQTCIIKGVPHLVLVAHRNIEAGEELLYDYGDRSKASLQFHPWLAL
ncbi:histone-lysine N-methyltransferase set-1 [Dermacentor albipictus]|uniref:histone-lysine N-methyltransferase set-1 n=1 Tax=Dermacentor albipictus TaxID=60249 RepID=UPI0038FBEA1D